VHIVIPGVVHDQEGMMYQEECLLIENQKSGKSRGSEKERESEESGEMSLVRVVYRSASAWEKLASAMDCMGMGAVVAGCMLISLICGDPGLCNFLISVVCAR
jgi:hypothetical protein